MPAQNPPALRIGRISVAMGQRSKSGWTETGAKTVLCLCDELFAIHSDGVDYDIDEDDCDFAEPLFTITHRPTGYALRSGVTWELALETLLEVQRRPDVDWTWTDPLVAKSMGEVWNDIKATVDRRLSILPTPVAKDSAASLPDSQPVVSGVEKL